MPDHESRGNGRRRARGTVRLERHDSGAVRYQSDNDGLRSFPRLEHVRFIFGAAVALAVLALATGARATQPPPKPDFSGFAFLTGNWNCIDNDPRGPLAYHFTWGPDASGYWFNGTRTVPAFHGDPPTVNTDRITFDGDKKHFVELETGSYGLYDYSTTAGFVGSKIVLHSVPFAHSPGSLGVNDFTAVKLNPTEFTLSGGTTVKGIRKVLWTGSCMKAR